MFQVDSNKVKSWLDQSARDAQRGQGRTAMLYWKPKNGENKVRILPPWTDQGANAFQFHRETWIHWNVGPDGHTVNVVCPAKTEGAADLRCPVCDERNRLMASDDITDKELGKQLRPKLNCFSNVIDTHDPVWKSADIEELTQNGVNEENLPEEGTPKIQIWGYGKTVLSQLMTIFNDNVNFCSIHDGHNILVRRTGKGLDTEYSVRPEIATSNAPCTEEAVLWDLDIAVGQFRPFLEVKALMQGVDPKEARLAGKAPEQKSLPATQGHALTAASVAPPATPSKPKAPAKPAAPATPKWLVNGVAVIPVDYPECFSESLDESDSVCNSECANFQECCESTQYKLQPAKPKRKPAATTTSTAASSAGSSIDDLEAEMRAALNRK
jgi:hypothetical protein